MKSFFSQITVSLFKGSMYVELFIIFPVRVLHVVRLQKMCYVSSTHVMQNSLGDDRVMK